MTTNGDRLLVTVAEAARMLSVSEHHARDLIAEGRLPSIRLGRAVRVPVFALQQWIASETGVELPSLPGVSSSQRLEH